MWMREVLQTGAISQSDRLRPRRMDELTRNTATSLTKLILVRSFSLHIRLSIILIAITSSFIGSYTASSFSSRPFDWWTGTNKVELDGLLRSIRTTSLALQTRLKAPSPITRSTCQYLDLFGWSPLDNESDPSIGDPG
jgi:hypothetical protein